MTDWGGKISKHNYPATRRAAPKRPYTGRPSKLFDGVRKTLVLEGIHVAWLEDQPGNMSETVRGLIDKAMEEKNDMLSMWQ
jgi:hypothetical protein